MKMHEIFLIVAVLRRIISYSLWCSWKKIFNFLRPFSFWFLALLATLSYTYNLSKILFRFIIVTLGGKLCPKSKFKTIENRSKCEVMSFLWKQFMSDSVPLDPVAPFRFTRRSWNPICPRENCKLKNFFNLLIFSTLW